MSQSFQTVAALAIAALALVWLIWRSVAKSSKPGCGGGCGCPSSEIKAKLNEVGRRVPTTPESSE